MFFVFKKKKKKKKARKLGGKLGLLTSGIPRFDVSRAIPSTSSTMPCGNDGAEATTSAVLRVRCLRTSLPVSLAATAEEPEDDDDDEGLTTLTRIPK